MMMCFYGDCNDVSSDVALVYNDRAVLENFHVSAVFRLFRDDEYNILSGLKTDEYRSVIESRIFRSSPLLRLPSPVTSVTYFSHL